MFIGHVPFPDVLAPAERHLLRLHVAPNGAQHCLLDESINMSRLRRSAQERPPNAVPL